MNNEIFNIKFTDRKSWKDDFNRSYDDYTVFSKKTYEHREEGLNFDYKYAISVIDMFDRTWDSDCEGRYDVELYLIPVQKSLNREVLEATARMTGCEDSFDPDKPEDIPLNDLLDAGNAVRVGYQSFNGLTEESIDELMDLAASVVPCIDALRGFYLDKRQNAIGTTGWDMLNEFVGDGTSFVERSMARWKK